MFYVIYDNFLEFDKIRLLLILLSTFFISYIVIPKFIYTGCNRPSIWCLSSALVAPLLLLL